MLGRAVAELVALVAPPACPACRAPLAAADELLCTACRRALPWLPTGRCPRCGLPVAPRTTGCARCPARAAAFERAWAPVAYEGPARALVAALKFRGAFPVADLMAAQIAAGAPPALLEGATLVPAPLHPARRRARGFDQAERLALALGARTGRPVRSCLRRAGAATRQLGAGRATRLRAERLDVRAVGPAPRSALVVDDVHTTGATLQACARALRAAGAQRVAAVAYARTLAP